MPEARFDNIIHAPTRLRICGLMRAVNQMDFAVLRDSLGIADAALSKHLKTLSDAGYVRLAKAPSAHRKDARRLTWVGLTPAGQEAFDAHIRALREIAGTVG
ncbi:transcriptional regulator [Arthrobacter sp. zg-Y820]|uniref:transcriptional regulator n=1 Tax=unclassified Arthrobacter TaxID=235627 RepID=UPI001E4BDA5F|nr:MULTISPECIES: transcriptional regulator [unclassified Arthrobacter]MCC9198560.1 transcriptional regulator [Arthrobacter sp. zg-Y820]MDK1281430.1 transcriptional regulator [Arthrobacter sp. zg.Y820]MDK1361868.1 transcriptional regulator [Arthrobacter sp. zg-Y1219]WIB09872.1 transcriptional regulator [Arthrobacter sp. zg-Y820]